MTAKLYSVFACALLLAACSGGDDAKDKPRDPVAAAALDDPLMTDPDLTGQNRGNAALDGGLPDGAMPAFKRSPEEIAAAKTEAERLLGRPISPAPGAERSADKSALAGAATPLAVAEALQLAPPDCAKHFAFSATWAARLPARLPVYPRGHTLVAGGIDAPGCLQLRSIRFVTPVGVSDVIDFYFAAASNGLMPKRAREGKDEIVTGGLEDSEFRIYARKRGDGLTEVDLVTSGL